MLYDDVAMSLKSTRKLKLRLGKVLDDDDDDEAKMKDVDYM